MRTRAVQLLALLFCCLPTAAMSSPHKATPRPQDRVPPHDIIAEMALLGGIILDPGELPNVAAVLHDGRGFWVPAHGEIFRAMLDAQEQSGRIDLVILRSKLLDSRHLEEVGGLPYLEKLAAETPGSSAAPMYAAIVAEKHRRRMLADAGLRLIEASDDRMDLPVQEIATNAMESIGKATSGTGEMVRVTLAQACAQVMEAIESKAPACYRTCFASLDEEFHGIPIQGVTTIMGSPSSGKTTLMLQMVSQICAVHDIRAEIYSNEQPAKRIAATLLSMNSGVALHTTMNTGRFPTALQWTHIKTAQGIVEAMPIDLIEEPMNAADIYLNARLAKRRGVGLIVVDYLQDLPAIPGYTNGEERISESMVRLKRIARELGMAVIVISQLDKATGKENRRPTKFDGLYSSKIEQASDLMIAVWRPNMAEPAPQSGEPGAMAQWKAKVGQTELLFVKNKYGPLGEVTLHYNGRAMRFEDPNDRSADEGDIPFAS